MRKKVLITVTEQYTEKLDEVAQRLGQHKMVIDQQFPFGVITGSLDEAQILSVSKEDFIESIEDDDEVTI